MTYRELLDIYVTSRDCLLNGIPVRFKESPNGQSGDELPVAGMVANIVFIQTTQALDELPGEIASWRDAPSSISVEAIEFNFRGFEANNAELDALSTAVNDFTVFLDADDPNANYLPWLMDACDSDGSYMVDFKKAFGESARLNDEVDWFEIVSPESFRAAGKDEIESAKHKNHEAINALRKHMADTVSGLDKTDPGVVALMDFISKTDSRLCNLISRLY